MRRDDMNVLYKRFDEKEALELIDEIRDTIVEGYSSEHSSDFKYHSTAEYVGYNPFALFVDKGIIDCAPNVQQKLEGVPVR